MAHGDVDILIYPANSDKNSKRDMKSAVTVNVTIIQPVISVECEAEVKAFIGEAKQLEFNVLPENASDKTLVYKSSDESVLTVDNDGVVTGVKTGEAIVTAESVNGIAAECRVLIREYATDV